MSDRDALIAICEHMGLKRVPVPTGNAYPSLNADEFADDETRVIIGEGDGYSGFFAHFTFDADARAVSHGVWE